MVDSRGLAAQTKWNGTATVGGVAMKESRHAELRLVSLCKGRSTIMLRPTPASSPAMISTAGFRPL